MQRNLQRQNYGQEVGAGFLWFLRLICFQVIYTVAILTNTINMLYGIFFNANVEPVLILKPEHRTEIVLSSCMVLPLRLA